MVAHRGNRAIPTTYADFARLTGRFAAELRSRGICPGERVVLWGENSAEWIGAFFGCVACGVLVVPLDAAGSPEFAAKVVAEVAPRLVVGDARLLRGRSPTQSGLNCPQLQLGELSELLPWEPDWRVDETVGLDSPLIAEITHEPVSTAAAGQRLTEELHLDSLGRVQLQSGVETQLGVEISDASMASLSTLDELRALVYAGTGQVRNTQSMQLAVERANMKAQRAPALQLPSTGKAAVSRIRYPHWPWSAPARWLRAAFIEWVVRPLVRVIAAPRVLRASASLPREPMLLVANHVNTYDLPFILYALPGQLRRRVAMAMSAELLADMRSGRNQGDAVLNLLARPASWLLMALFNVFPLPRLSGFRQSFAHAGEALDRGYSVLVFPEGRRSQTGALQSFRPGVGLLVQASGVPVLPVVLQGMGAASARSGRRMGAGQITVRFGDAMRFAAEVSPEEITRRLEAAVRDLQPS